MGYYKIPYNEGTELKGGGNTAKRCNAVGMKAVCPGNSDCGSNSAQCMVTPLSKDCAALLNPLSEKICNTTNAWDCPDLKRVTIFFHGHHEGDKLIHTNANGYYGTDPHGATWQTTGTGESTFYAYCAECNTCEGKYRQTEE